MAPARETPALGAGRVFRALLARDVVVVRREIVYFLMRTAMQPVMIAVVFGYLLPKMGFVRAGYTSALLPGVLAQSLALAAVQSVALPMVTDFGFSREIEDRLLAPIPNWLVALEKVCSGTLQALIAALFVLPVARLIGVVQGAGRQVRNIRLVPPNLETLFLSLTGRKLD